MNAEMQAMYWRIQNNNDHSGQDAVSLLMPSDGSEPATLLPTEVSFCSRRSGRQDVDLKWSEDDSDLFLNLLERISNDDPSDDEGIVLDINDGIVQGIVQLVALARFQTPWPTDELVGEDINTVRDDVEVGDLVAVNTLYGYPMAIIVGMDSIDLTCVLLESIEKDGFSIVPDHSVIILNRNSALPNTFAASDTGEAETFH